MIINGINYITILTKNFTKIFDSGNLTTEAEHK